MPERQLPYCWTPEQVGQLQATMPAHPGPGFPGEFLTQGAETAGDGLTDLGGGSSRMKW